MDVTSNRSQHQIKNGDIVLTYLGMLCMGKPYFEAVHEMDDDRDFYKAALGITRSIPSEETLRQRMDDIGDSLRRTILEQNVEMLLADKIQPTALANGLVPVDIDVTPMDNSKSKKEGVSRTYKGFDGYAPMMAYIGTEGYAINFELREGKQHCQKGTVVVSSILFPILKLKPGGQTLVTRMRKSSVCIMPMENVSSFIVR